MGRPLCAYVLAPAAQWRILETLVRHSGAICTRIIWEDLPAEGKDALGAFIELHGLRRGKYWH